MKTKIFLMIAALAIISLSSCKKEAVLDQASIDLADDDAVSDAIFEDVLNTSSKIASLTASSSARSMLAWSSTASFLHDDNEIIASAAIIRKIFVFIVL